MKNARLETRLLAIGISDSIAFATPRAKHTHSLWVSLGWLLVAVVFMAYVAALT